MRTAKRQKVSQVQIELWEWELIQLVARQAHTSNSEYLKTELLKKFAELKSEGNRGIQNWKNYLWVSLKNRAANLKRNVAPIREFHLDPVESGGDDEDQFRAGLILSSGALNIDQQVALSDALREFSPNQRLFWEALKLENGNRLAAAKRLRIHRNTARAWLGRIRQILERHSLP